MIKTKNRVIKNVVLTNGLILSACMSYAAPIGTEAATGELYRQWVNDSDRQMGVEQYANFLKSQGVDHVINMPELLISANDWRKCNAEPFNIPPQNLWENIIPTLKLLHQLKGERILSVHKITSSYRPHWLNSCAGGSAKSKHVSNYAIDIEQKNIDSADAQEKICTFWRQKGSSYRMGLGFYPSGKIHIDTSGYRTWGANYRSSSSPCLDPSEQLDSIDR